MRADFLQGEQRVATVEWDGARVHVREASSESRDAVERIFRISPVVSEDPSGLPRGTSGPAVVEPGDLDWFLAAARVRGEQEGFGVRFATDAPGGWDPAGSYRRMGDWVGAREAQDGVAPATTWR